MRRLFLGLELEFLRGRLRKDLDSRELFEIHQVFPFYIKTHELNLRIALLMLMKVFNFSTVSWQYFEFQCIQFVSFTRNKKPSFY